MTGTQWLTTGAQGAQSLNYRDPVVGYKGPGGASYSITRTQWLATGAQGGQLLHYRDPASGADHWVPVIE